MNMMERQAFHSLQHKQLERAYFQVVNSQLKNCFSEHATKNHFEKRFIETCWRIELQKAIWESLETRISLCIIIIINIILYKPNTVYQWQITITHFTSDSFTKLDLNSVHYIGFTVLVKKRILNIVPEKYSEPMENHVYRFTGNKK